MDCTSCVAKTKALIRFAVTAKLVCVFVIAYTKSRFSHDEAHIMFDHSISLYTTEIDVHQCHDLKQTFKLIKILHLL